MSNSVRYATVNGDTAIPVEHTSLAAQKRLRRMIGIKVLSLPVGAPKPDFLNHTEHEKPRTRAKRPDLKEYEDQK